ncbi:MAG: hypothetical protein ACREHE_06905 [Rhizomicrobium sp.]
MAIASFSAAIGNDAGDAPSYGLRAKAYDHMGDSAHAAADRAKLKELDPENEYGLQ